MDTTRNGVPDFHQRPLTREEFHAKFRGRMLLFVTEAWAARKQDPSSLGMLMDQHALAARQLLGEMFDALVPKEKVLNNGAVKPPVKA